MKSVQLGFIGRQFDSQYTFDLQNHIPLHDFSSIMYRFNTTAQRHPPPGNMVIWLATLLAVWVVVGIAAYIPWAFLHVSGYILIMPLVMAFITTIAWIWRYRYLQRTFEYSIVEICNQLNATENIRGINYRLTRRGSDVLGCDSRYYALGAGALVPSYALVIEMDERYTALAYPHDTPDSAWCCLSPNYPHQVYDSEKGQPVRALAYQY